MPIITSNLELIQDFIIQNKDRIDTNLKLSDLLEDNLIPHIDKALQAELSRQPYNQARPRLAPINVGKKIITKLSSLYNENANRDLENPTDQEIYEFYQKEMELDVNMGDANHYFNTHKYTALEPYVTAEGSPKVRVIPADRFLVWNDGTTNNPSEPQVFIKFLGVANSGKGRFELWSDEEKVVIEIGVPDTKSAPARSGAETQIVSIEENEFGVLPFVYITKSKYRVMPAPDEALFSMSVLVPILLTDLNLISKFQSYSMLYTIDVDVNNLEFGPSNIYNFKSDQQAGAKPQVGVLSPNANIEALGASVLNQLSMFLETRNLKASSAGKTNDASASGIALMIRNIDTTEDRKSQEVLFRQAENNLLMLIANHMHPYWVSTGAITELRQFSSDVNMTIRFADPSPIVSESERIENALAKRDNGLSTQRMALAEVHPDLTDQDIDVLAEEIQNERATTLEIRGINVDGSESSSVSEESADDSQFNN